MGICFSQRARSTQRNILKISAVFAISARNRALFGRSTGTEFRIFCFSVCSALKNHVSLPQINYFVYVAHFVLEDKTYCRTCNSAVKFKYRLNTTTVVSLFRKIGDSNQNAIVFFTNVWHNPYTYIN